ncbi:sialyltransferase-like protein 1 [Tanacetum coccineum]
MSRAIKPSSSSLRRPTFIHLICAATTFSLLVFLIQSYFYTGTRNKSLNVEDVRILSDFQSDVHQCVVTKDCSNRTLCEEHLNPILPASPPFHPRQFRKCAVVGNSGDLLKTEFGEEIDSHDAVIRDNEAPVNEVNYSPQRGIFGRSLGELAKKMVPILKGSYDEVLVIKSVTHRDFNKMIDLRGAKGTGMKSVELALSMCDIVDINGFTVDPGYTEWTSTSLNQEKVTMHLRKGVIRIHSPMRAKRAQDWSDVPSREKISMEAMQLRHELKEKFHEGKGESYAVKSLRKRSTGNTIKQMEGVY